MHADIKVAKPVKTQFRILHAKYHFQFAIKANILVLGLLYNLIYTFATVQLCTSYWSLQRHRLCCYDNQLITGRLNRTEG